MNNPKLQLALDTESIEKAMLVAAELHDYWDILEIGTVLLLQEGLSCVGVFRNQFPDAVIMVDTKIIDSGKLLAESAYRAGADIISVVSAASDHTILACIETANMFGKRLIVDHLSADWIDADLIRKCKLGANIIGLHIPKDIQGNTSFRKEAIIAVREQVNMEVCIAGGITPEKIKELNGIPIDIFVVGGYLLDADNRDENGLKIRQSFDVNMKPRRS